jgi:hypothetical protein
MTDTKSCVRKSQWVWPSIPANQTQFEEMMRSLDAHLASEGRRPAQRPLEAARLLSMTLGYSGKPLLPVELIQTQSPYDSGWCIKAACDWFEQVYSEQLKIDFGPGSVVVRMRGSMWRLRLPKVYGRVDFFIDRNLANNGLQPAKVGGPPASVNILSVIDGLTMELSARLDSDELNGIEESFRLGDRAVTYLEALAGDVFFDEARNEYRSSVASLLASSWRQAQRNTASCAEMAFKGLLRKAGRKFPTGNDGHDIVRLGQLVTDLTRIMFDAGSLAAVHCSTDVRYVKAPADVDSAWSAHRSLLTILSALNR